MITETLRFQKSVDKLGKKQQTADIHYSAHICSPTRSCSGTLILEQKFTDFFTDVLNSPSMRYGPQKEREATKAMQAALWQGGTTDLWYLSQPSCHMSPPLPFCKRTCSWSRSQLQSHWLVYFKHLKFSAAVLAGNGSAGLRTEDSRWNESGNGK